MKRTSWRALLIAAGAVLAAVASAKAEYHPTLGRWMQRDPVGYVDGMGLYEYVRSNPAALLDWLGLRALSEKEAAAFKKMRRLIDEAKGRKGFEDFAADLEKVKQELLERIKKIEEGSQDPEDLAFVLEALKEWVDDPGDRWGLGWGGIGSKSFTPGSSQYPPTAASSYKCNIFVAEMLWRAFGLVVPMPDLPWEEDRNKHFPPRAADYANPDVNIPELAPRRKGEEGRIGDIITNGAHCGLYLGHDVYISARAHGAGAITGGGLQHAGGIQIKGWPEGDDKAFRFYNPRPMREPPPGSLNLRGDMGGCPPPGALNLQGDMVPLPDPSDVERSIILPIMPYGPHGPMAGEEVPL